MIKEYKGRFTHPKVRIGIVVSRFNELVTKSLLNGALEGLERFGVPQNNITVAWVPGAFEIPLVAKQLAETGQMDAIICLGALIKGSTRHFEYVASQNASGIARISLETNIPLIYEVLTAETIDQAIERAGTKAGNKGYEAVQAALEMIDLLHQIKNDTSPQTYSTALPSAETKMKV
jgi:6,7-dimethyl-8-ribityllumazine synthase